MARPSPTRAPVPAAPAPAAEQPASVFPALVNAANTNTVFYVDSTSAEVMDLIAKGFVETNADMRDANGHVAGRATPAGVAAFNGVTLPAPPAPAAPKVSAFAIDTSVSLTKRAPRVGFGPRASVFPFDDMPAPFTDNFGRTVYASFHVPVSAEREDPYRSMASTVSSANARYAVPTGEKETVTVSVFQTGMDGKRVKVDGHYVKIGEQSIVQDVMKPTRKFEVRRAAENDPSGKGARIFRTL